MTNKEAVNWLINITADIGKTEHRDLWHYEQALTEIKDMLESEQPEIVRCGECEFFQCNIRFDGFIPKGADEYECRHWCGGCDPMDYCSYGKRRERRTE